MLDQIKNMKALIKTHKIVISIFMITLIALVYVNQQVLIYQIGLKVKENTQIYSKLVDHNRILVYNVLNLKSPVRLETKLLAKNIELDMPRRWQVVKLGNPAVKIAHNQKVAKRGLFANLFTMGREAEASPVRSEYIDRTN